MIREEVRKLQSLGRLPESNADESTIAQFEEVILTITSPVNDDEACVLVECFGSDDCYGLAWTLVHLIETAPSWPIETCLHGVENPWVQTLRKAAGL